MIKEHVLHAQNVFIFENFIDRDIKIYIYFRGNMSMAIKSLKKR